MLEYNGAGIGAFLPNVPARDLKDDEVTRCGGEKALIRTGLYQKPSENKALGGAHENKAEVKHARQQST